MAERFNLTAQLQLQAPRNVSQVVGGIKKQLSGITANVQIKGDARTLAKINKQMQGVNKSADASAKSVGRLNRNLSEAARRFSVITVATGTMLALARAIKNSVGEAIAFERELVRISQVGGKTVKQLEGLTKEVTKLSTVWGASSKELLNTSRVLAQAGFSATKTKQALDILAKTSLGATFDSLADTTEGAIAVLRQFRNEAKAVGGDIKFLEQTMDAINSVSKKFAVESGDLITVIRRVGGVFEAAGGKVNELIALFTSVRATTRESAETIATGLRTIFTRIQRTDTVDQLAKLGIQLNDAKGQFVGAYEAVRRLSAGLSALDPRDFRFSEIVESLGGFRQIGKVIPLIRQFATAQDALNVAQTAGGSTARDAATAQQALAVQAAKVGELFAAMTRKLVDSSTFRSIAQGALELAKAFIRIAEALEPLLPLITSLIALKIGKALAPGLGALVGIGGKKRASGGRVHAFARGGFVPGKGNRDTVPAMLQPGEFVIKKSSASKLGSGTLEAMNQNRFKKGSKVTPKKKGILRDVDIPGVTIGQVAPKGIPGVSHPRNYFATHESLGLNVKKGEEGGKFRVVEPVHNMVLSGKGGKPLGFDTLVPKILAKAQKQIDTAASKTFGKRKTKSNLLDDKNAVDTIGGFIFESFGSAVLGKAGGDKAAFDFVGRSQSKKLEDFTERDPAANLIDAKSSHKGAGAIIDKALLYRKQTGKLKFKRKSLGGLIQKFALGGIAKANKIGAAILDQDRKVGVEGVNVGVGDVKPYIPGSGFDKTVAQKGFGRVFTGKKYKISRQGLNEKTSRGFRNAILDGAVGGVDMATSGLSSDLGLGKASLTKGGKQELKSYLGKRGGVLGDLYESSLNTLNNKGAFKESQVSAPFDFPGGLSGKLRDNFSNLPSSWIDAKSSYASAGTAGMKGKIANELADEYVRSGEYGRAIAKRKKKAFGGRIDSVPALLTPGEYVINKSSAQSVGYSNLNKMNQTGVARFAAGGVVTSGRHSYGVTPPPRIPGQSINVGNLGMEPIDEKAIKKLNKHYAMLAAELKIKLKNLKASGASEDKAKVITDQITKNKQSYLAAHKRLVTEAKKGGIISKTRNEVVAEMIKAQKQQIAAIQRSTGLSDQALPGQAIAGGGGAQSRFSRAKGMAASGLGAVGRAAEGASGVASAAQNLAFFGATAISTAVQMSSFSDATKQATTETVAHAAAMLSVGSTVIQMLSGLAQMGQVAAAAEATEAGANVVSTTTEEAESGANIRAAASEDRKAMGTGTKVLLGMAAAALVVSTAFKFLSANAKAQADAQKKANDKIRADLESGKGTGAGLKAGVAAEVGFRQQEQSFSTAGMVGAGVAAVSAAASMAAAGAAFGSVVPVVGTLIGAIAGGVAGWLLYNDLQDAAAARTRANIDAINANIDAYIANVKALNDMNQALADIDLLKDLTPEERVGRRTDVLETNMDSSDDRSRGLSQAFLTLQELAVAAGKPIGQLGEADFADMPHQLALFQTATANAESGLKTFHASVKVARQNLEEAAAIEITGEHSFDDLMDSGGDVAKNLDYLNEAIRKAAGEEYMALNTKIQANKRIIAMTKDETLKAMLLTENNALSKESTAIKQRERDQIADNISMMQKRVAVAQQSLQAEKLAAAAAEAWRKELLSMANAMKGVRDIGRKQERFESRLADKEAIRTGGTMSFVPQGIQGLGDLSMIDNIGEFDSQVSALVSEFPEGPIREAGKKQLKIIKDANTLFTKGKEDTLAKFGFGKISVKGDDIVVADIIEEAGFTEALSKLPEDIRNGIKANLKKLAKGGLTGAEFEEAFAEIREHADQAGKGLKSMQATRDRDITGYQKHLDYLSALRADELAQMQKSLKVEQTVAKLRLKARGSELTTGGAAAQRQLTAQLALRGATSPTGEQAMAGNAQQVARIKEASQARLQEIATLKLSADNPTRKKLMTEANKLKDTVKKTTAELERMATQTEKVAELMEGIEAEQEKRAILTGILEDIVKGGRDERRALIDQMRGVGMAVATGTVQNQTPEQRTATFAMLDRLEKIMIPGAGGLTGKQVKQELVFRDAIRMGLDPQVAEALATATSKEQELINSLDKLTDTMLEANRRLGGGGGGGGGFGGGFMGGLAKGGPVYRAGGGRLFKPKGTDTVPAMLTPGEFVIRKSAVDRIGMGNLQTLNRASGGVIYRAQGGGSGGGVSARGVRTIGADLGHKDIRIATGDIIKRSFIEGIQGMGKGRFLTFIRKEYGDDTWKDMLMLIRAKQFKISDLRSPNTLANIMDEWRSWIQGFRPDRSPFTEIGGRSVKLRGPAVGYFPPEGAEFGGLDFNLWFDGIDEYVRGLDITGEKMAGFRDRLFNEPRRTKLVKEALKAKGFDPVSDFDDFWVNIFNQRNDVQEHIDLVSVFSRFQGGFKRATFNNMPGNAQIRSPSERFADIMGGHQIANQKRARIGNRPQPGAKRSSPQLDAARQRLQLQNILNFAQGGAVPGEDSVPAMLTPGEFVMSKSAVQRHGVGYMKSLNRGRIPGFRRGGLIAGGNVAYRANGGGVNGNGTLALDPTRVQTVLSEWNTTFSETINKIIRPMETVGEKLQGIAEIFQQGMKVDHTFAGDMLLNVNIGNKDAIAEAVTVGIMPGVIDTVTGLIDAAIENMKDNP